jgi:hypothetical protein
MGELSVMRKRWGDNRMSVMADMLMPHASCLERMGVSLGDFGNEMYVTLPYFFQRYSYDYRPADLPPWLLLLPLHALLPRMRIMTVAFN